MKDNQSQLDRLSRQIEIWKSLCLGRKDVICMGDANICALNWLEEGFQPAELSDMIQNFMLESAYTQVVNEWTRSEVIQGGIVSTPCIEHCYTNAPDKVSKPEVLSVALQIILGL